MRHFIGLLFACFLVASFAQASHLSEAEVLAMEKACDEAREEKLGPERAAIIERCVQEGEGDAARCAELYASYGNYQTGAIRKMGKYYDLPVCVESYKARKHYHINPGR